MPDRESTASAPATVTNLTLTLDVTIRLCERGDLPALEWFGLFAAHRQIIRDAFAAQERGDNLMLLACTDRAPIGQIWIDLERKRVERVARLWALRVFPWLQGRGLGAQLIEAAEKMAIEAGCRRVEIGAEWCNPRALALYQRLGYSAAGALRETYSYRTPGRVRRQVHVDESCSQNSSPRGRTKSWALAKRRGAIDCDAHRTTWDSMDHWRRECPRVRRAAALGLGRVAGLRI